MRLIRDLQRAFGLLTILPVGAGPFTSGEPSDSASLFPLVGYAIGVVTWGVLLTARSIGDRVVPMTRASLSPNGDALVVAVLVVAAWALISRFLHWDGLGDVADAFWGGYTPQRRLEIMSDSAIGAFGVMGIVLVFALMVSSLAALLGRGPLLAAGWFLVAIPVLGRQSATFAAWLGTPARPGGLGRSVMGAPSFLGALLAAITLGAAFVPMIAAEGIAGAVWCASMLVVAAGVPHVLAARMGGVTGDVMGASVVITEAVGLALLLCLGWF